MTEFDDPDRPKRMGEVTPAVTSLSDSIVDGFDPIEREAFEWVARFVHGQMTSADLEAMKTWYGQSPAHAEAYAEVRRVWEALGPAAIAVIRPGRRTEGGRSGVVADWPAISRRAVVRAAVGGGLAAAAAGYLVVRPPFDLWPSYAELMADYRTGTGEQRRLTLADTVSLDLNTRTSIAIRSQTVDAARIKLISGELAVSTDAAPTSLTVVAADGRIVAANANFNLRCDGDEVWVSCLKGDLKVERTGLEISLTARQRIGYGARGMGAVTAIDPESVTAWQHGLLIFDAMPVAQVVEEVNRYRSGRIILMNPEIGRRLLTAQLLIAEADKIVAQIVHIFGAKARALPGGVVILT